MSKKYIQLLVHLFTHTYKNILEELEAGEVGFDVGETFVARRSQIDTLIILFDSQYHKNFLIIKKMMV